MKPLFFRQSVTDCRFLFFKKHLTNEVYNCKLNVRFIVTNLNSCMKRGIFMSDLTLWDSEYKFMCVVWENAPVNSGELVELCKERLGWKKSTTYNAIRKMSEKELIKNENAVVSVLVPKEMVQANESENFVERTFDGSLPSFLASFLGGKTISANEAQRLTDLINLHKEE